MVRAVGLAARTPGFPSNAGRHVGSGAGARLWGSGRSSAGTPSHAPGTIPQGGSCACTPCAPSHREGHAPTRPARHPTGRGTRSHTPCSCTSRVPPLHAPHVIPQARAHPCMPCAPLHSQGPALTCSPHGPILHILGSHAPLHTQPSQCHALCHWQSRFLMRTQTHAHPHQSLACGAVTALGTILQALAPFSWPHYPGHVCPAVSHMQTGLCMPTAVLCTQ